MAKNNNLTDFLRGVADAIRAKKGTSAPINPQDFESEIASIEGGGGGDDRLKAMLSNTDNFAVTAEDWGTRNNVPSYCFYNMSRLDGVEFSNAIKTINEYAFYGCYRLTELRVPNTVETINRYAFNSCSGLTHVKLGTGLKTLDNYTFQHCRNIVSMNIKNTQLKTIGYNTFYECKFTEIELPQTLTSIGDSAFYSCTKLQSIVIPNGVTNIMQSAFVNCYDLAEVTVGTGVTNIGSRSFYKYTNQSYPKLTMYMLRDTPPTIRTDTFNIDMIYKIYVPSGCTNAYQSATNWSALADYISEE